MYLRLLSAEEYGAWSQFGLMLQFLQPIMCWGLLATMARLLVDTDNDTRARKIAAALKMVTVLNVALLLLVIAITQQRFWPPLVAKQILQLMPFAVLAAGLAAYPSILMGTYVAHGKALQYRSLSLVGFILQAGTLGACASQVMMDARMAIFSMLVGAGAYAALSAYQLVRAAKWRVGLYEYKALLMFGGPVVLYTTAGQSSEFATRYVLATKVTGADFGAFSAGMIYASVIAMVSSAINLAWTPLFYRHAQEWMALGVYRLYVDVFAACMATCGAFLIVFSDELLALYSGGNVSLDVSIVGALVISAWLNSAIWMSLSNPIFHQNRSRTVLAIVLLSIGIAMPIALLLISRNGIYGAAIALLFNAFVLCLIAALALRKIRDSNLNYSKLFIFLFLLVCISSPIMNSLYNQPSGLKRLAEKSLLFAAFAAATVLPIARSGRNVLRIIEGGGAR
jgi:O-antigen/teichoic acid export membrane protein